MPESSDPLAPLVALPGVADAADRAREALGEVHRHPTNRHDWPDTATEAALRAGRASSGLDGGTMDFSPDDLTPPDREGGVPGGEWSAQVDDPVLAGALRVSAALDGEGLKLLTEVWRRAPLQALARLHLLAAAGLVDDQDQLGRPRSEPGIGERLDALAQLVTGGSQVAAPVLAAVVHGELLALRPFGSADGVVARAASRLVATSTGLDPHNLGVPEVAWLRRPAAYRDSAEGFRAGTAEGVGGWLILCCGALEAGAREARSIADAHAR